MVIFVRPSLCLMQKINHSLWYLCIWLLKALRLGTNFWQYWQLYPDDTCLLSMCSYKWVLLTVEWLQSAHIQDRSDFNILDWINWSTSSSAAKIEHFKIILYRVLNSFGLWVISPNMRSESISWGTEFLTILAVVAWGHVLWLHVLIKMRLGCSQVAAVSAGPGAVHFGHFWLNQSLKISCNILSSAWDALES